MFNKTFKLLRLLGRSESGFTFVEVVVAIAVVTIALLATVVVGSQTVNTSNTNERKVVATNLAREGVELVRSIRDSNWQVYSDQLQTLAINPAAPIPIRAPSDWDCYSTDVAVAGTWPFSCSGHMSQLPAAGSSFQLYPGTGEVVPYLSPVTGGAAGNTKSSAFIVCANPAAANGMYVPSAGTCPASKTYYRRLVLSGQVGHNNSPTIRVQVFTTWPDNKGADIVMEEYLTDWRKF